MALCETIISDGYKDGELNEDYIDLDIPGIPQIDISWVRCCHYLIKLIKNHEEVKMLILKSHWPKEMEKYLIKELNYNEAAADQQTIAIFSTILDLINYG